MLRELRIMHVPSFIPRRARLLSAQRKDEETAEVASEEDGLARFDPLRAKHDLEAVNLPRILGELGGRVADKRGLSSLAAVLAEPGQRLIAPLVA